MLRRQQAALLVLALAVAAACAPADPKSCKELYVGCGADSECCSGVCGGPGACQPACKAVGAGCGAGSECCSGVCGGPGACQPACKDVGVGCGADSECCSGWCGSGACMSCGGLNGDLCTADSECCSGYCTGTGSCAPASTRPPACGDAGATCTADSQCCSALCTAAGTCAAACPEGQAPCHGAACTPLDTVLNCGFCDARCTVPAGGATACVGGACTPSCPAPEALCVGTGGALYCADFSADTANCGDCGVQCPVPAGGATSCVNGACVPGCTAPDVLCSPQGGAPYCADFSADPANCGGCNVACGAGASCVSGTCVADLKVLSTFPGDGATNVPSADAFSAMVTFDQALDCATVTASTFHVAAGGVDAAGTVQCGGAGNAQARFTPGPAPLQPSTTYTARLDTQIKGASGASLRTPYSWSFTTSP